MTTILKKIIYIKALFELKTEKTKTTTLQTFCAKCTTD